MTSREMIKEGEGEGEREKKRERERDRQAVWGRAQRGSAKLMNKYRISA